MGLDRYGFGDTCAQQFDGGYADGLAGHLAADVSALLGPHTSEDHGVESRLDAFELRLERHRT
jgi:hypothetical protein